MWLQGQLEAAAPRFGVELAGEIVNTFDMRSAGAQARADDRDVWMRVVVEDDDYQPACRWDGNVEANSIVGREDSSLRSPNRRHPPNGRA